MLLNALILFFFEAVLSCVLFFLFLSRAVLPL